MLRSSIYTAGVLALGAAAFAQKQATHRFERVTGPVRHAGVYHLATGTWTHGVGPTANLGTPGSDIIYNNTTDSGYYAGLAQGETWTASGRIPSTTSPEVLWNPTAVPVGSVGGSAKGCQDNYTIDGFEIAYCSELAGNNTQMQVAFFQAYSPVCTAPAAGAPQGGPFLITGLPGRIAPLGQPNNCWIVSLDLAGAAASFNMAADGDGVYSAGTDDAFGWTFTFPSITSTTTQAGPLINGAPADGTGPAHLGVGWKQFPPSTTVEAAGYDGTRFDGPAGALAPTYPANGAVGLPTPAGEDGTDPLGDDAMRIDGNAAPGCYFFGGPIGSGGAFDGPYSNFHMELYAKVACVQPPSGTDYCFGDGLNPTPTTPCPCTNFGAAGNGCASSFNSSGAHLTSTGHTSSDDVVLFASGMNATGFTIFLKGNQDNVNGVVFGDGVRCTDGTLIRLRSVALSAGTASFPNSNETVTLSVRGQTPVGSGLLASYTAYYRNAAAAFCPPATFNTANGVLIPAW